MSFKDVGKPTEEAVVHHKIRITLTSRSFHRWRKCALSLLEPLKKRTSVLRAQSACQRRFLRITTRKTPCGEGSKTWDRYQMRIHKRIIDLQSPAEIVKQITSFSIEPGVEVEVTIADA